MSSAVLAKFPTALASAGFFEWWTSRLKELVLGSQVLQSMFRETVVTVAADLSDEISTGVRWRDGQVQPVTLEVAARMAVSKRVVVRPVPGSVLVKEHVVPAVGRADMEQLLSHEIASISPFSADELFWRWDIGPAMSDRKRTAVILTMVPKSTLAKPLALLDEAGIVPDFAEVDVAGVKRRLTLGVEETGAGARLAIRVLSWTCVLLALLALLAPVGIQTWQRWRNEAAISELEPAVTQVRAAKQAIMASGAGKAFLKQEAERTGNALAQLAALTRAVPDDSYLTSLRMHDRQATLCGESTSSAHLMTVLSAAPSIHNPAFAAPLTRTEGTNLENYCITATVGK
ncbi:MAG TPA: PilN domain-containing protein [Rhodopila sp.]|uniref:PilN domain-containing protein n=1 Tax=Rhodopila sp. TaxID=2480087 RepID=UPI002B81810B|nr:PilN domain-containing protein [Rhodopila sp.]HVY16314.1 PilN domain-containing protein [Rhodopila sp.]